jgi:outer membrane protein assembly factor BamB
MTRTRSVALLCALVCLGAMAGAQAPATPMAGDRPTNDLPTPYRTIENFFKLPEGRTWGSTSAVEIDKDGKSVWIAERCGGNSACLEKPTLDPILHFDASGKLMNSFGAGLIVSPHGIFVDRDGNIWLTDYQDNRPPPQRGAGGRGERGAGDAAAGRAAAPPPTGPVGPPAGTTKGHQIFKFNRDGKLLMTLGKPGGAADPEYFYQPNDVLVAPNGDIFVAQGHGQPADRLFKFSKDGKLIKAWGKRGTGPNEFDQPHTLAMDSKGRLFVGDRNNNRIQILDQNGTYITEWRQFSRPSGIYIDKKDTIYVTDSESGSVARNHDGWKRGIRIGSARDGSIAAFIPDPETRTRPDGFTNTSAAEGVAADPQGNVYGAEVGPRAVKKYVKNQ